MLDYSKLYVLTNPTNFDKYLKSDKYREYEYFMVNNLVPFQTLKLEKPKFIYMFKSKKLQYMLNGNEFHLLHKDIYEVIKKNNLTGLDFYDAIIYDKPNKIENYDYKIFKCLYKSEEYDNHRSDILFKISFYASVYSLTGLYYKDDIIPNVDFFTAKSTRIINISNKAKLILEKHCDKSIGFIPLNEHINYVTSNDYYIIKEKLKKLIDKNEFVYDYLEYQTIALLFFGTKAKIPEYREAMKNEEFKRLWDECNTINNCKNNEFIESKFSKFDTKDEMLKKFSHFDYGKRQYILNEKAYKLRYIHKMLKDVI